MIDWSWIATSVSASYMVVLKALGVYLALVAFTRLMGLRSFSKMSSFDFAVTVAFGSVLASAALTESPPLAQSVVALATLFGIQYVVAVGRANSDFMIRLVDNAPILIMAGSTILHDNLKKARMTEEDLYAKLREANVTRPDQVRAVVMESTGDVSVLHAAPEAPPLDRDLLQDVRGAERLNASA